MPAVPSAEGPSRMSSKHTGHDFTSTYRTLRGGGTYDNVQALFLRRDWTGHYNLDIMCLYGNIYFITFLDIDDISLEKCSLRGT